jgi:hypothetical protein
VGERLRKQTLKDHGQSKETYADWQRGKYFSFGSNISKPIDQQHQAKVDGLIKDLFGSYYGRLIAASPKLMEQVGINPNMGLGLPEVCNGLLPGTSITQVHLNDAMGNAKASPSLTVKSSLSFTEAVRVQLKDIAGDRIPELAEYNSIEKSRERLAYEFLFGKDSEDLRKKAATDPRYSDLICDALSMQSFWENENVVMSIEAGKMVGTAAAMVGGLLAAPLTGGSSIGGAIVLVGALSIGEATYYANDHAMRGAITEAKTKQSAMIKNVSSNDVNQVKDAAGKVQTTQTQKTVLETDRAKAQDDQVTNRALTVASVATGAALGKAMKAASTWGSTPAKVNGFLKSGGDLTIKGTTVGVDDAVDALVEYGVTGQVDPTGVLMGVTNKTAHANYAGKKNLDALAKKAFGAEFDSNKGLSLDQKRRLTDEIVATKYKNLKGAELHSKKLEVMAAIERSMHDVNPEKINQWITEKTKGDGNQEAAKAWAAFTESIKHLPKEKQGELIAAAYSTHMTGKSATENQPADKEKLDALARLRLLLKENGIDDRAGENSVKRLADSGVFDLNSAVKVNMAQKSEKSQKSAESETMPIRAASMVDQVVPKLSGNMTTKPVTEYREKFVLEKVNEHYPSPNEKWVMESFLQHASTTQKQAVQEAFETIEKATNLSASERKKWIKEIHKRTSGCKVR